MVVLVEQTSLEGVLLITPKRFEDARGHFSETWNRKTLLEVGIDITWVQDNSSLSRDVGTVRGLHYQAPPHAQAKLVRCGRGSLFDVAVDIRVGSPTYGHWVGHELSAENGRQMLIPEGFLHGFVTRAPETEVLYKCSDYYAPACDGAVRFDSPRIGINWDLARLEPVLSEKDAAAQGFSDFNSPFVYNGAL